MKPESSWFCDGFVHHAIGTYLHVSGIKMFHSQDEGQADQESAIDVRRVS